jgi:hypothetical protein
MGREAIRLSWINERELTGAFTGDFVADIAKQMMQIVIGIATAQDPRMANRERLVNTVLELARFEVLLLNPPPQSDATGLRGKPGITGELKQRIAELARKDKRLRDLFVSAGGVEGLPPDELRSGITARYLVLRGWSGMHQIIRMAWHDVAPEPLTDWYRPLVENACACEEQKARELLGIESSLGGRGRDADIEALARGTFMNFVLAGEADPVSEWREHYKGWNL